MTQYIFFVLALLVVGSTSAPACQSDATVQLNLGNCTIPRVGQSDVQSWGIKIDIEGANELCFVPSTVLNDTFLTATDLCASTEMLTVHGIPLTLAQCASRRGGLVAPSELKGAQTSSLVFNPAWTSLRNPIDGAAEITMRLFRQTLTMTSGLILSGQNSSASHLGLATNSTFLRVLKENGLIASLSWGLNVGSQSVQRPRGGSLVLGGWDQASMASSSFYEFDIANTKIQNRECPLQVKITGLTMSVKTGNGTNTKNIFSEATGINACIEPYDNLFRLPDETLSTLRDYVNQIAGSRVKFLGPGEYSKRLVNLEPGLVFPAGVDFNATLRFVINDNMTIDVPHYEFQRPLRGLDENGTIVLDPSFHELQIYGDPAPLNAPVLGKAFLSQVYLFVDYEARKFYMAPQNLEATTSSPISSSSCKSPPITTNKDSNSTEKAVIVVGSLLGALIIAIIGYLLYKWRRSTRGETTRHREKSVLDGRNDSALGSDQAHYQEGYAGVSSNQALELNGETRPVAESVYTAPVGPDTEFDPTNGEIGSHEGSQRLRNPSDAGSGFSAPRASFAAVPVSNFQERWSSQSTGVDRAASGY